MKTRLWLLVIVLLLLNNLGIHAQSSSRQPIDPTTVFTDKVEIVETLPILNFDNAARLLWHFDAAQTEWHSFPYPKGLQKLEGTSHRSDGSYLLYDETGVWTFTPVQGEISHPNTICGNRVQPLAGEGGWVLYRDKNDQFAFCFTETGETTQPLPDYLQKTLCERPIDPLFSGNPSTSPDQKTIVFMSCLRNVEYKFENFYYDVYAYQITTGQIIFLGKSENHESIEVARWLDNRTPVIHGTTLGSQQDRYIYLADSMEVNSLQLIAKQYISFPQFYSDPPRYTWVEDASRVVEYDLNTRERVTLINIGCEYYVATCTAVPNGTTFSAEHEVTRVAIFNEVLQAESGSLTIYDTRTSKSVYQTTIANTEGFSDRDAPGVWLDENMFFHSGKVISFKDYIVSETRIGGDLEDISPDKHRLLVSRFSDSGETISIYDFVTDTSIPLTFPINHGIQKMWQENNLLYIRIYDEDSFDILGAWLIQISNEGAVS